MSVKEQNYLGAAGKTISEHFSLGHCCILPGNHWIKHGYFRSWSTGQRLLLRHLYSYHRQTMALPLVRAYIAFIDSNQILITQRSVVSDHFAETPYPHPNDFNWIYKIHSLWSLRTLGPTFLPGTATCWAHLFQNSKTGCLLCSVKMPTRESFLKDHSHRHCQEKEFLARKNLVQSEMPDGDFNFS